MQAVSEIIFILWPIAARAAPELLDIEYFIQKRAKNEND